MIAEQFQTFLLDLDGVVYVGDNLLPDARRSVERLRSDGKTLRFLTNDPRPTRHDVVRRLHEFGIAACVEEVITSGWATATHLREHDAHEVYVVGSKGLCREIERAGIHLTTRDDADAVVVGCSEVVDYLDLRRATRLIRRGADFMATNPDPTFPTPDGPAPATGAIVAAVRTATGNDPCVIGKPHAPMFELALQGLAPGQAVMIGDSLFTDVRGAKQHGIPAMLVGSEDERSRLPERYEGPDLVMSSLADLFDETHTADV